MYVGGSIDRYEGGGAAWGGGREEGEVLIIVLFSGDQHLSPPSPSRSLFPRRPGGRGGRSLEKRDGGGRGRPPVMNERRWQTPRAVISDPPPNRRAEEDNEGGAE